MRTLLAIALVGTFTSTVHAGLERGATEAPKRSPPPRDLAYVVVGVHEGEAVLETTTVDVREVADTALVRLTIGLACKRDNALGRVRLDLPLDARIIGMSYAQGGAQVASAQLPAAEARAKFEASLEPRRPRDPALLEVRGTSYRLSVFPMSSLERTTAIVTIAMPRFGHLVIEGRERTTLTGGTFARATTSDIVLASQPSAVADATSLYAAPDALPVAHPALRPVVARTGTLLRACFDRHPRPTAADFVVNFAIDDEGKAMYPKVTGGTHEANTCIAEVAADWRFHPSLARGAVDYPLHFTP